VNKIKNIVIVEDEIIIAEDLRITLKNLGYHVSALFTEGQSIIDEIDNIQVDLILMDIMLNGVLSGIETAEIIQQKHDIPIIYVTAYANSKILQQVKKTNPFGYIVKPFEERELHATIELAFSRENEEKIQKLQYRNQKRLLEASLAISNVSNYNEVIKQIIMQTAILLNSLNTQMYIYNEIENIYVNSATDEYPTENDYNIIEQTLNIKQTNTTENESGYYLSIPLIIENRVEAIIISKRDSTLFDPIELTMINTFANHAKLALYNANIMYELNTEIKIRKTAQQELMEQLEFEQVISEISSQFVLEQDLNSSIDFALKNICRKLKAYSTILIQVLPNKNRIQISHSIPQNDEQKKNALREIYNLKFQYFDNWIINAKLGKKIELSADDELTKKDIKLLTKFSAKHLFAFPIKIKNEISGFLVACYNTTNINWSEKNNNLLSITSDILSNALENNQIENEKKIIQNQLYQAQKMEVIGKFAGGIAHDFNNLLTVINGYSELALKKIKKDEPAIEEMEVVFDCGLRAAKLTEKLLGFSRKQIFMPIILNLNEIILDLNKIIMRLLPDEINLIMNLSDEDCIIKADPGQIEQIIVNLVVNAKDAMNKKGEIIILTDTITFEKEIPIIHTTIPVGEYVVLQVIDNGFGIPSEVLEHIFEPFFTTKKVNEGTGLGLSTVFGIIKQNEGFIDVESEVGKGTTFSIYLPKCIEEEINFSDNIIDLDNKELPQGNEKILFIEDEENIQDFVKSILEEQGYQVICGSNGLEGLEIAKNIDYAFELLITDVRMPKISGPEMAKELISKNPNLKILFVSGHDNDELSAETLDDINYHFLQKPFDIASLSNKVRKILDT